MAADTIYLIGGQQSKRTNFFQKAAVEQGVYAKVIDWENIFKRLDSEKLQDMTVKIDPPAYKITGLEEMHTSLEVYQNALKKLDLCKCLFLNSPKAILYTLDKRYTKEVLMKNYIPVTDMIEANLSSVKQLFEIMENKKVYSVFIKPVNYSGAAGIAAFRINPVAHRMKLYTTCMLFNGKLYNTKKLYIFEDEKEITYILEKLIKLGTIVERWYHKDTFHDKSYDLRIVYQFRHIEHIVARQSRGPFTNLHLNNQAVDVKALGLKSDVLFEIEQICDRAMSLFDGLNVAGIDIMLDRGSMKPRIIEINGQGDLIYQDIYSENRIYKRQIEYLCAHKEDCI